MSYLAFLIPIGLGMGALGLLAFLWSLRNGQYDDLDGASERVLLDLDDDRPIVTNLQAHSARGRAQNSTGRSDVKT